MSVPGLLHGSFSIPGLVNDIPPSAFAQDEIVLKTFGVKGATLQSGQPTTREFVAPMTIWGVGSIWDSAAFNTFLDSLVKRAGTIADLKFVNPLGTETKTLVRCKLGQVVLGLQRYDAIHGVRMHVQIPFTQFMP